MSAPDATAPAGKRGRQEDHNHPKRTAAIAAWQASRRILGRLDPLGLVLLVAIMLVIVSALWRAGVGR